ncbi:MAG: MBL fold metallo-hydrolase [Planctomycetota bacterium]
MEAPRSSMQLHCLGTAGYHPCEGRHTSCYFLPQAGLLLDAGTGLFRLPPLIETDELDILLSHAHLDHVAGLTFLIDVLYQRPVQKVRVWGEAEKLAAVREHLFADLMFPVPLDVDWRAVEEQEEIVLRGCRVKTMVQDHPGGSIGYRLDWQSGESLLYLTDTTGTETAEAIEFCSGADFMMHECYFGAEHRDFAEKTGHTWTGKLAKIAELCQPKRLLLTHVNPLDPAPEKMLAEVRQSLCESPIDISMADDGLVVPIFS